MTNGEPVLGPARGAHAIHEFTLDAPQLEAQGIQGLSRAAGRDGKPWLDPYSVHRRLVRSGESERDCPGLLLDGVAEPGDSVRFAYVLFDPLEVVSISNGRATFGSDPLATLFDRLAHYPRLPRSDSATPRFRGGAAGFLGYDLGRAYERLPSTARSESRIPDLWFGIFDRGVEFDLSTGEARFFVVDTGGPRVGRDFAARAFAEFRERLERRDSADDASFSCAPLRSNLGRGEYLSRVAAIHEYIRAGHIYQVNLSQRFASPFVGSPRVVYERLRRSNPAPFQALIETGSATIASCSPEAFLKVTGERVETRPIKGTRRRTGDSSIDARAITELESSRKEVSELNMIIDLERNDLGKVARVGSVRVVDPGRIERYSTVIHRTAIVEATLRPDATLSDLLRGAFPGGSITGVPKLRAMEIIEELEGLRRGLFTGAIGFVGFDGDAEFSIAIRTLIFEDGVVHFHVGGGIVLDSDPVAEFDETLLKGKALAEALGQPLASA